MNHNATIPIFDGHNDYLSRVARDPADDPAFFVRGDKGHIDLPRAREGGLAGGLFACFPLEQAPGDGSGSTDAQPESPEIPDLTATTPEMGVAQQHMIAQMGRLFRLEREGNGQVRVARTADEITASMQQGALAAVVHFEGAEAIDPNLDALYVFYQAGLRSLGIVWSRPNAFGHGVPFDFPHSPDSGPGLTDAGRALVRACNQLGVVVDLSHLTEQGFWDVAGLSTAPLVATHSNAHALCPSARNLTDRQLDAVRDSGGLVGVNFHTGFLREDGQDTVDTPLAEIVRHVDYLVNRMGIEHVALGSDFDGATMPAELGDVAGLPRLMEALRARGGYEAADLARIGHGNWLRVLRQTWG
jgi:membrane dipeptidase